MSRPGTQVPEGTFRFEIKSVPQNDLDLQIITWALQNALALQDQTEEVRFVLPYQQGGGYVELEKMTANEYANQNPENASPGSDVFTGWVLTDHYTDSMTNVFVTPIYCEDGVFFTDEM